MECALDELAQSWNTPPPLVDLLNGFVGFLGRNDLIAYLVMLAGRRVELRRVPKPNGTLFLRCDLTAGPYIEDFYRHVEEGTGRRYHLDNLAGPGIMTVVPATMGRPPRRSGSAAMKLSGRVFAVMSVSSSTACIYYYTRSSQSSVLSAAFAHHGNRVSWPPLSVYGEGGGG